MTDKQRIAKVIAAAGLCSRREAERWIEQGRVKVDGERLTTPAFTVSSDQEVRVDGKPLPTAQKPQMWMFHKPKGCITSRKDEKDRPTIYDFLPPEMRNLHTVGRLDYNSEGLLLLTNHAPLKRHLELPATGWKRHYRVRVQGVPSEKTLKALRNGMTVEGVRYRPIEVSFTSGEKAAPQDMGIADKRKNLWLLVTLTEGKNREIRKLFEHFDHPVSRLIRVGYGPFQLAKMPLQEVQPVKQPILRSSVPKEVLL